MFPAVYRQDTDRLCDRLHRRSSTILDCHRTTTDGGADSDMRYEVNLAAANDDRLRYPGSPLARAMDLAGDAVPVEPRRRAP
jgi:hypothetical protein